VKSVLCRSELNVLICDIDYTHNAAARDVADTSRQPYNNTLSTVANYLEVTLVLLMPGRHMGAVMADC